MYRKRYLRTSVLGFVLFYKIFKKDYPLEINIYLDESGDLGWKFTAPYRNGGSSRHLTIACLIVPKEKKHLPKRLIQKLYKKFSWNPKIEKKYSEMTTIERTYFAQKAKELRVNHPTIKYFSMTVKKENVQTHIRADGDKLYNYMIGLTLLSEMSNNDKVIFVPDPRSMKVESGNSMHDYLQTQLWFHHNTTTILETIPQDSDANRNIQFADMLSGVVQGHYEDANTKPWQILASTINSKKLYFR